MSELEPSFEYFRDKFFVNPKSRDPGYLGEAAKHIAESLLGNEGHQYVESGHPTENIRFLDELISDMKNSRRFDHLSIAQLHPSDNITAILANFASTLMNNNTIIGEVSPVETRCERESIEWMAENIAGYDKATSSGSIVSGGTRANETAMYVARELLVEQGWKGRNRVTILANEMAHYSIVKAAKTLAPNNLISLEKIPLKDNSMVMDTDALAESVARHKRKRNKIMAIVGLVGETETGLIENLDRIADIAKSNDIYLHFDGAYGAPFKLSRVGSKLDALKEADSITCDPHKYMYLPYGAGVIMFKDSEKHGLIKHLNEDGEDYMFKDEDDLRRGHDFKTEAHTHLGIMRIEGSMGGQAALALHHTIKQLGRQGLGKILDHTLDMTELFNEHISRSNSLRPLFASDLNTTCLIPNFETDCYPQEFEQLIEDTCGELERVQQIYVATTSIPLAKSDGTREKRKVFRVVPTHPHTGPEDIEYIAESLLSKWDQKTSKEV